MRRGFLSRSPRGVKQFKIPIQSPDRGAASRAIFRRFNTLRIGKGVSMRSLGFRLFLPALILSLGFWRCLPEPSSHPRARASAPSRSAGGIDPAWQAQVKAYIENDQRRIQAHSGECWTAWASGFKATFRRADLEILPARASSAVRWGWASIEGVPADG